MSPRRALGRLTVTAVLATAAATTLTLAAGPASATGATRAPNVTVGNTYEVCSSTLALRTTPEPTGPDQGTLHQEITSWSRAPMPTACSTSGPRGS